MTINAFTKLAEIERRRKTLDVEFKTGVEYTDREWEAAIKSVNNDQAELRFEASAQLRQRRAELIKLNGQVRKSLATEANKTAKEVDYMRLEAAAKHVERQLKGTRSAGEIQAAVRQVEATGDRHLIRAMYEHVIAAVEDIQLDGRMTPDAMRRLTLKDQLKPKLEGLLYSPEQLQLQEVQKNLEQEVVNFLQDVEFAREHINAPTPSSEQYFAGLAPEDVYRGLTDGIRLTPQQSVNDTLTSDVNVELDSGWNAAE